MKRPFTAPDIEVYDFETVPLRQQMLLVDERWIPGYDKALVTTEGLYDVSAGTWITVDARDGDNLNISLYNILSRHHRVRTRLPRSAFVVAVEKASHGVKPFIFVTSEWFVRLHLRRYATFALVDAIGVKAAMRDGSLTEERLLRLRSRIDAVAAQHGEVAFISFADNVLLKSDWRLGDYEYDVWYSYAPEMLLHAVGKVRDAFRAEDFETYAVMTQGANEYDDPAPLHISDSHNHVSLNSLGLPFAQLLALDQAARAATKEGVHARCDLYLEESLFLSLRVRYDFDRQGARRYAFEAPLSTDAKYVCADFEGLLRALQVEKNP